MPDLPLDQPRAVREPLDTDALERALRARLQNLPAGPLTVRQFPGGFSNLTYLVEAGEGEAAQAWVLRRPPPGASARGGHDMGREFRVLKALQGRFPAPDPVLFVEDEAVLGAPFYLMERAHGVVLRAGMAEAPSPADMARVAEAFVDTLAALHALDAASEPIASLGRPEGYLKRQVDGWAARYQTARTDDVPAMEAVSAWLDANQPASSGTALVHNDYKYDNLVLDPESLQVRAVLDWELATVGSPLLDLGTTLGYWVQADDPPVLQALALSPTTLTGNPTRADLAQRYAVASGRDGGDLAFAYTFGLFKIAVIVQQIWARYQAGHTSDPRFAGLGVAVQALARHADHVRQTGRI